VGKHGIACWRRLIGTSATIAIVAEVPMSKLRHAVTAYPSRSEIWLKLVEKFEEAE